MIIQEANRLANVSEYYFSQKLKEIAGLQSKGFSVINLGIGNPDGPPHPTVLQALDAGSQNPKNHGYQSYRGIPELRKAMGAWMQRTYKVEMNPETEILPLIGSKEGIFHIAMAFLNEGDLVLVPDPGYPAYTAVCKMTGAQVKTYRLDESQGWRIDFDSILSQDMSKVKILWVNFLNMPTGTDADLAEFKQLVDLAREHSFLIVHDNPYSLILNDSPKSIFQVEGAKDVVLELQSLSKSHNMAGWRVGWVAGREDYLNAVLKVKSNIDSGMFKGLQLAACAALDLDQTWFDSINLVYAARKEKALALLQTLGCTVQTAQKGMFLWARIPQGYASGIAFTDQLLAESHIFITPGALFGASGDQYVRVSLCSSEETFQEAIVRAERRKG